MNIADSIRHHARRRPGHPAVVARDRTWDYRTFAAAVDTAALRLHELGVHKGDVVGVAIGDTPEHLAFLYGIARLGAVILPMDTRWTDSEKQRVSTHFGARLVLIGEGAVSVGGCECVTVEASLRIDGSAWERLTASPTDDELGLVLSLSSGTTGRPKGPLISHRNMHHRFLIYTISLTMSEHDRFACSSPLYFSGSRALTMCQLYFGGTVVLLPPPVHPAQLIREINEFGCTSAFIVPTIIRRLIHASTDSGYCLPHLRLLISTGAALFPEDRALALARITPNIINFYGSAEGGGISALTSSHPKEKGATAGSIVWGTEVRVVDAEFRELPRGEIGRICYRSGGTAREFYRDPEASRLAFRDGWYLPGDLGFVDEDGFVTITGREKDMIIRGGINIYPNEIENVLLGHENVAEAAVVGAPSAELGEEVIAFVTTWQPVQPDVLRAFCASQLAPYKVPKVVRVLPEMPRTNVGKIDKQRLRGSVA
jgi:acyl-CoA synthetase (AMP-forming)/AMP-acid ligase II